MRTPEDAIDLFCHQAGDRCLRGAVSHAAALRGVLRALVDRGQSRRGHVVHDRAAAVVKDRRGKYVDCVDLRHCDRRQSVSKPVESLSFEHHQLHIALARRGGYPGERWIGLRLSKSRYAACCRDHLCKELKALGVEFGRENADASWVAARTCKTSDPLAHEIVG